MVRIDLTTYTRAELSNFLRRELQRLLLGNIRLQGPGLRTRHLTDHPGIHDRTRMDDYMSRGLSTDDIIGVRPTIDSHFELVPERSPDTR